MTLCEQGLHALLVLSITEYYMWTATEHCTASTSKGDTTKPPPSDGGMWLNRDLDIAVTLRKLGELFRRGVSWSPDAPSRGVCRRASATTTRDHLF